MKRVCSVLAAIMASREASAIQADALLEIRDKPGTTDADPNMYGDYDAITGRGASEGATENGTLDMEEVLSYEDAPTEDLKTRPMCKVGGEAEVVDDSVPGERCCRAYEDINYKGFFMDFCLYNFKSTEQYWQLDILGWHNEIGSWRCDETVSIKICAHTDDTSVLQSNDCPDNGLNVQTGFDKNPDVGHKLGNGRDSHDSLWVRARPPNGIDPRGMVFDYPNCEGASFIVETNVWKGFSSQFEGTWKGSWNVYDAQSQFLLAGGNT